MARTSLAIVLRIKLPLLLYGAAFLTLKHYDAQFAWFPHILLCPPFLLCLSPLLHISSKSDRISEHLKTLEHQSVKT